VVGYTKISQTSGNFGPTLANQGRFGFLSSNGNAQLLASAPFSGNGEIHLMDLDENGSAASITTIQADQFDIFNGATDAQFGFSSVKLGDVNQDGAPDYLVGAPGLTPHGALVLLTTTDAGWDADTLSIPASNRFNGANWGANLAANGSLRKNPVFHLKVSILDRIRAGSEKPFIWRTILNEKIKVAQMPLKCPCIG
jgi:hypothetical protein